MGVFIDEEGFEYEQGNLDESAVYDVKIKVVGVGGGGGNALEYMAKQYKKEYDEAEAAGGDVMSDLRDKIEFIAVNTDVAALKNKDKTLMRRIQIGKKTCKGRGAGGRPEMAAEAAKETQEEIEKALEGAAIVFVSAGMGGGTGTGAAPVIASIAQEMGIITVGVVTKPFEYEREFKMNLAMKGIDDMRKHVDSLLIIPNEKLLHTNEKSLSFKQAFAMVDDVLYRSVKIISDVVYESTSGRIGTDFADLCTILKDSGDAHIALGTGVGENKIKDAVSQVVNSPLVYIALFSDAADPSVEMIQGVSQDDNLTDTISIAVIATGFKDGNNTIKSLRRAEPEAPAPKKEDNIKLSSFGSASLNNSSFGGASAGNSSYNNDNDDIVTSKNANDDLSKIIQNTLGDLQSRDRFSSLQEIFNNRKTRDDD